MATILRRVQRFFQSLVSNEGQLYQRLVAKVMGDHAAAERLIAFEKKRAPQADRAELIRRAIDRLDYDRR